MGPNRRLSRSHGASLKKSLLSSSRGQVVIEYILLLVVAATLAALIVRGLANRDPDNPGLVVEKWLAIQQEIGNDLPEKCAGSDCN